MEVSQFNRGLLRSALGAHPEAVWQSDQSLAPHTSLRLLLGSANASACCQEGQEAN